MEIIVGTAAAIAILGALVIVIIKSMGIKASPFLIFAIVDIFIGLIILGFALYDFKTAVGEFAGILGEIALLIGEPVVGVMLIIDIIAWQVHKRRCR